MRPCNSLYLVCVCVSLLLLCCCVLDQKKLSEVELTYLEVNTKLMADLNQLWDSGRVGTFTPILKAFIKQEKKIAQAYGEAVNRIK